MAQPESKLSFRDDDELTLLKNSTTGGILKNSSTANLQNINVRENLIWD